MLCSVYGLHSCKVQLKFILTYINFTKKKKKRVSRGWNGRGFPGGAGSKESIKES